MNATTNPTAPARSIRDLAFEVALAPSFGPAFGTLSQLEEIHAGSMLVYFIEGFRDARRDALRTGEKLLADTQRTLETLTAGGIPHGASDQLMGDHARAVAALQAATTNLSACAGMIRTKATAADQDLIGLLLTTALAQLASK